jgi:hypothetical protein
MVKWLTYITITGLMIFLTISDVLKGRQIRNVRLRFRIKLDVIFINTIK